VLRQFPAEWPVQFLKRDWVGKALEERSREVSVTTAKIISSGCASAMLAGYTIPEEGALQRD
jgi:hypothetical protein